MQRLRRRAARVLGVLVLGSILVVQPAMLGATSGIASAATPGARFTAVEGGPLFDLVTDGSGRAYATNPSRNRVEVISIATGTLEASIAVGSDPRGLDLSPDGSTLYVANNGATYVSVIDLALRREVRHIAVPAEPSSSNHPWAIVVTADGRALMTTSFDTTGGVLRHVDLARGTVTARPELGEPAFAGPWSRLKASGDRSTIGLIHLGRVALFSVASDSFVAQKNLEYQPQIALDGTGSKVLVGKYVLGRDLGLRATTPAEGSSGVAVDQGGTTGYRGTGVAVDVLDMDRGLVSGTIALPAGGGPSGAVALSRDQGSLVVLTGNGISVVPVGAAVPTPCLRPAVAANVLAVCGGPLADVVAGSAGRVYASNPGRNQIEVVDLASRTLEAPILVGSDPRGLGLGPDGNTLYVANYGGEDISVVDLTLRREVRRIRLPSGEAMWQPSSVAVADNGTALVVVGTSSVKKIVQLRLATGSVVDRIDGPGFASRVWANRGNTKIAVVNAADLYLYDAAGDTYGQLRQIEDSVDSLAFDAAGSRILLDSHMDTFLLDGDRTLLGTLPQGGGGVAVQASGAVGFHVRDAAVDVLNLARFLPLATISLPEPIGSGSGGIALSADEGSIAVVTEHGVSIASVASAVPNPPCTTPSPRPGVAAVCGQLVDIVADSTGHAYATNGERNQVEVVSLATGTLETAIPVGSHPMGLDLSPDGTTLYVANWGGSQISVIDLALRREVRRITVPVEGFPYPTERPSWIAVLNDGTALLVTHHHTQGTGGRMLQIDLADGSVRHRTDSDAYLGGSSTRLEHSGDRSRVVVVDTGTSSGPVAVYRADTDSFGPAHLLNRFVRAAAVDATGAHVLVEPGGFLLNGDLVLQHTIPASTARGVAMNAAGTTGYSVGDTGVRVSDVARGVVTRGIALPEPAGSGSGAAALTPDGDTLAVLTASGISVVSALIPPIPYSTWTQPPTAPLDALGSWIYPANDPRAAAGQRPPTYSYGHYFGFANDAARGGIALVSDPTGKLAMFTVTETNGTPHTASVAFDWKPGRFYFLLVYQVTPGSWAAWVFDNSASTWIPVGQLALPSAWGKLSPTSVTAAVWYGPGGARCSAYPRADVFFYRPIGYVGGIAAEAALVGTAGDQPGTCPAMAAPLSDGWARYRMGADAAAP